MVGRDFKVSGGKGHRNHELSLLHTALLSWDYSYLGGIICGVFPKSRLYVTASMWTIGVNDEGISTKTSERLSLVILRESQVVQLLTLAREPPKMSLMAVGDGV